MGLKNEGIIEDLEYNGTGKATFTPQLHKIRRISG